MAKAPESRRMGQTILLSLAATCLVIAAPLFVDVPMPWLDGLAKVPFMPADLTAWALTFGLVVLSPGIYCAFALVFGYFLVGPFKGHGPASRR